MFFVVTSVVFWIVEIVSVWSRVQQSWAKYYLQIIPSVCFRLLAAQISRVYCTFCYEEEENSHRKVH